MIWMDKPIAEYSKCFPGMGLSPEFGWERRLRNAGRYCLCGGQMNASLPAAIFFNFRAVYIVMAVAFVIIM
jgi:hypothetical protein